MPSSPFFPFRARTPLRTWLLLFSPFGTKPIPATCPQNRRYIKPPVEDENDDEDENEASYAAIPGGTSSL